MVQFVEMDGEPGKDFDLHTHTRHSSFNEGVPYWVPELLERAREVGLDGLAITGHNTFEGIDFALNEAARLGLILIPAIEITSKRLEGFRTPHILALGITPDEVYRTDDKIPKGKDAEYVANWIHQHGGIAIAPHPRNEDEKKLTFNRASRIPISFTEGDLRKYGHLFDAIEVANTRGVNPTAKKMAEELNLPGVASSDAHRLESVGLVRTKIFGKCDNWQDAIQAIKENRVDIFVRDDIPRELRGRKPRAILKGYVERLKTPGVPPYLSK